MTDKTRHYLTSTYTRYRTVVTVADLSTTWANAWGFGHINRGEEGRQEHGGPMVPGPWAFAVPLAVVIDGGHSARRAEEARRNGERKAMQEGDEVAIEGEVYRLRVGNNGMTNEPWRKRNDRGYLYLDHVGREKDLREPPRGESQPLVLVIADKEERSR